MRKIIVHEFISLDGVIQAPGGKTEDTDGGFAQGGWTVPYWDTEIGIRFSQTMATADALLLGRKTWQIHSVFNTMDDMFAVAMNAIQKYVVSKTLKSAEAWKNSTILSGDPVSDVQKLKNSQGKDILTDGSSVLLQALLAHDLVDELLLHVYPVSLGGGKKIFPEGVRIPMKLAETKPLATGVVFQHYEVLHQ